MYFFATLIIFLIAGFLWARALPQKYRGKYWRNRAAMRFFMYLAGSLAALAWVIGFSLGTGGLIGEAILLFTPMAAIAGGLFWGGALAKFSDVTSG